MKIKIFNIINHYIAIIAFAYAFIGYSCIFEDYFVNIGDGFEYGYISLKEGANIYYNSQGIVNHSYVFKIEFDNAAIVTYSYERNSNGKGYNYGDTIVWIINKQGYIEDPMQLESRAISGPHTVDEIKYLQYKKLKVIEVDDL